MRWMKSTTQKVWVAEGHRIPACITPKNDYCIVDEDDYAKIVANPIFKSLIAQGSILVLDKEPAELKNSLDGLQSSNAVLQARNTELEARIKELEAGSDKASVNVEAIKEEAVAELKAEAIAELQSKDAELQSKDAELQSKDAEIAELKKQLKAAEKKAAKAE